MPGARCTRGLVCNKCVETHTSIQVQSEHSGIPCAMALRLMPRSSRRRIRLVTIADGLAVDRKPGRVRTTSASLTPATGARTTRFCRTLQRRSSCAPFDRSRKSALRSRARPTLPRPPHPAPTSVTIAIRPSRGTGCASLSADLPDGLSGIFSRKGLDGFLLICPSSCFVAHRGPTSPLQAKRLGP